MKKSLLISRKFALGVLLACSVSSAANAMDAELQRVAVLPFKMNAEKDLSFLRNGIFDMLSSRLSDPAKVQVVSRTEVEKAMAEVTGPIDEAAARKIGQNLEADFVLFGSLTMFGNSLSIDAKMLDLAGTQPPVTIYSQSPDLGAVIPKIDQFAGDINARIFGRQALTAAPATPPVAAPPARSDAAPDPRAHPEKLLQGGTTAADGSQASPFINRKDLVLQSRNFWKSSNFKYMITGIAVGDVDGDGLQETVVVGPTEVAIYRFQEKRFTLVERLAEKSDRFNIGVDVADINGNGRAEIFVTSLNNTKTIANSTVQEYDGKAYVVIAEDQPWYFRVTDTPTRGKILLGQASRLYQPYVNTISEMRWDGAAYVPQNDITVPQQINVLGVALGNMLNDGGEALVACNKGNNIVIATTAGEVLYKSNDKFGGSVLYYSGARNDQGQVENPIYLPLRLLIRNQPAKDARSQVIVVNNHEVMNMRWERRDFTETNIEALNWDGVSLGTEWTTRKMSRFISDIQIADFDNDGRDELLAALVIEQGQVIFTSAKSTVIAYELEEVPETK